MSKDEELLDRMIIEFHNKNAAFIKYITDIKNRQTKVFCFYEGEDGKYYNSRVRQYFGDNFITITLGGKNEVLTLLKQIRNNTENRESNIMFFIDRDFDYDDNSEDEDLYITPCYSIENLYIGVECLKRFLITQLCINELDESNDDLEKCLELYRKVEDEFHKEISTYNILFYVSRKNKLQNRDIIFNKELRKMIKLKIDDITNYSFNVEEQYKEMITLLKYQLQIEDDSIQLEKNEIMELGEFRLVFHGKRELEFYKMFVKELINIYNKKMIFRDISKKIQVDVNVDTLGTLSQYAETPKLLHEFLNLHRKKFNNDKF